MNRRFILHVAASLVVATAGASAARAQAIEERSRLDADTSVLSNFRHDLNVAVTDRWQPGYEAAGLRWGTLKVWPSLTTGVSHTDNVFAFTRGGRGDVSAVVSPQIQIDSDWPRHELQAYARLDVNRYARFHSEDSLDASIGALGRADVSAWTTLDGALSYVRGTEARYSPPSTVLLLKRPIRYNVLAGSLAVRREVYRLRVSGQLDFKRFRYDSNQTPSGAPVLESDRDRTIKTATVRVDYALSPTAAVFVEAAGNRRDYLLGDAGARLIPGYQNRTSHGYEVLGGANFALTALMSGEVAAGYVRQLYTSRAYDTISGLGVRTKVRWFPTQLTTVTLTATRTVEDAGLGGSAGYVSNFGELRVDHELLRNLILGAHGSFRQDEYRGLDRTDRGADFGVSAAYKINRGVRADLTYDRFAQRSRGRDAGPSPTINRLTAAVTLAY